MMEEKIYYIVVQDLMLVFASYEIEDCQDYIAKLRQEDLDYIAEEYGISESESPFTANFMAGYEGDAESAEIFCVEEFDEDDNYYNEELGVTFSRSEIEAVIEGFEEQSNYDEDE